MHNDWTTDVGWNHPSAYKDTDYYMTLEEISIELGVTRERAHQIERAALRKARRILESRGFKLEDLLYQEERRAGHFKLPSPSRDKDPDTG